MNFVGINPDTEAFVGLILDIDKTKITTICPKELENVSFDEKKVELVIYNEKNPKEYRTAEKYSEGENSYRLNDND